MLFAVPTFLAACLLFVAEPMLAKWLLPTLGGTPSTWSACLVTFQVLLLTGYGYSDFLSRSLSVRNQVRVHLGFLAVGVLFVFALRAPSSPSGDFPGSLPSALSVSWLLIRRIGVPFVVLASTTPLVSRWAAAVPGLSVPSLYAISNAGSLIGLLAYPFLIEPFVDVHVQLGRWAAAFALFGLSLLPACLAASRSEAGPEVRQAPGPDRETPLGQRAVWGVYAFVPSVMLIAATNHITVDIAATPLLWVLPLALYLVSFIVAFGGFRATHRAPVLLLWILGAVGSSMNAFAQGSATLPRQLGATLLALFASCLLCHGELAFERPPTRSLTGYYLAIAAGGALGGVFVTLIAPLVFSDFYELELASAGTFVVLLVASRRARRGENAWSRPSRSLLLLGCGVCLPLNGGSVIVRTERETRGGRIVERRRSFLGPLRVVDVPEGRVLTHGRIQHGLQLRDPRASALPTMYFGPGTALESVLRRHREGQPRSIGVVGLGVGTIAAYGERGDTLRFYELDPNVVELARRDFTFLRNSKTPIEIVVGDGRLALARELPHAFDVLVLDAFSSDAVPVHLLTREAFSIYVRHLAPDGILLVNVSNRHLGVDRVVDASVRALGLACRFVETFGDPATHVSHVEWGIAARDPVELEALLGGLNATSPSGGDVLFTDTRASVFSILR